MPHQVVNQSVFYRKGMVLGLSLAEVMLMVIFVLLLVLAGWLIDMEKKISAYESEIEKVKEEKEAMLGELLYFKETYGGVESIADYFKELVLVKSELERVRQENIILSEQVEMVDALLKNMGVDGTEKDTLMENISESLVIATIVKEKLDPNNEGFAQESLEEWFAQMELMEELLAKEIGGGDSDAIKAALKDSKQLQIDNKNLKQQLAILVAKVKEAGGEGYPPCWSTPDGKPQYIFDVILTDTGLVVIDNKLPDRVEEQNMLPIGSLVFEKEINRPQFLNVTGPLFRWSVNKVCRFYVRLKDATGAANKDAYKKHRQSVEDRFYIYLAGEV